jgi:hypothetical protein
MERFLLIPWTFMDQAEESPVVDEPMARGVWTPDARPAILSAHRDEPDELRQADEKRADRRIDGFEKTRFEDTWKNKRPSKR